MSVASNSRAQIHEDVLLGLNEHGEKNLDLLVRSSVESRFPLLSTQDKSQLTTSVLNDVSGYGFLETLLSDTTINEIMINSSSCAFVDRAGKFSRVNIETTNEELVRLAQKIAGSVGARCDASSPILDAWLKDGSRAHCVLAPIAVDGPYITIRRFVTRSCDLDQFCDGDQRNAVEKLILTKQNIVVAGGTSSGKTTLLNCIMGKIDSNQRIVSIEETAELNCDHPHLVRLLARSANTEGAGAVSLGELVKASLRMRPDRIVVGEVRSAEAFDLIQALNTGHDGSLCTIHANGPDEVIHRMASLAMFAHPGLNYAALVTQITYGIDAVIYVKKASGGRRYIDSISHMHDGELVRIAHQGCGTGD